MANIWSSDHQKGNLSRFPFFYLGLDNAVPMMYIIGMQNDNRKQTILKSNSYLERYINVGNVTPYIKAF